MWDFIFIDLTGILWNQKKKYSKLAMFSKFERFHQHCLIVLYLIEMPSEVSWLEIRVQPIIKFITLIHVN